MVETRWDLEADVVVLGSGGAALTAAIAAHDFGAKDVVILEKSGMVGGTTAMSGGMLWIPNNHYQLEAGVPDSEEDIVAYLDGLAPGKLDPETLAAFMETGPEMIRYFTDKTPVHFKVNEAANYNALGQALHAFDAGTHTYANLPYWLIIDQAYRDKYPIFNAKAGRPDPSYVMKGNTLEELAGIAGIDPQGLKETVERFNGMVRKGHDDDFNRGDNPYDNWIFWGDQSVKPPHCTLGVLEKAPFYAVKMEAGALGTSGGPKTNANAQVLDWNDEPIQGLYAAGNAMAAVLVNVYGGAGGTLGPGMTFGFIAGRHAATSPPNT